MLFDLELNDTANGKILGSPVYNCYVGYCTIPQIKSKYNNKIFNIIYI